MQEVFIPVMGMAPDDVVLTSWTRTSGDPVKVGDVLAVVETSKAELEIAAEVDGVLGRQRFAEGDTIAPGTTIGAVLEPGESEPDTEPDAEEPDTAPDTRTSGPATGPTAGGSSMPVTAVVDDAVAPDPVPPSGAPATFGGGSGAGASAPAYPVTAVVDGADGPTAPAGTTDPGAGDRPRHTTSPRARRLAAEAATRPTQPDPTPAPRAAAVPPPPPPPARRSAASDVPSPAASPASADAELTDRRADPAAGQDRYRAAISAAVVRSWQEIPHFAVTRELRVGPAVDAVRQWRTVLPEITLTDLLVRALALAMLERERRTDLAVGLAVATDRGVAIPVLRNVLGLGMVELVDARRAAVSRAREGRLHPDDGMVPITTLSNLGAVGVDQFTGVIPHGQSSMLTVGRAADRPVVHDGALAVACTMQATLNVDHRSWDGLHAGQALDRLARLLAAPEPLLTPSAPGAPAAAKESA